MSNRPVVCFTMTIALAGLICKRPRQDHVSISGLPDVVGGISVWATPAHWVADIPPRWRPCICHRYRSNGPPGNLHLCTARKHILVARNEPAQRAFPRSLGRHERCSKLTKVFFYTAAAVLSVSMQCHASTAPPARGDQYLHNLWLALLWQRGRPDANWPTRVVCSC